MSSVFFEILLLVIALSVDAFAAAFSCGVSKIRTPPVSVLIVAVISSLVLLFSLLTGLALSSFLPQHFVREAGFLVFFVLGLMKLFDRSRHREAEEANRNRDDVLSAPEAAVLGAVLSVDCAAAGLGAGLAAGQISTAFVLSLLVGALAFAAGGALGRLLSSHCRSNLCWVSGTLLLMLAFLKLF